MAILEKIRGMTWMEAVALGLIQGMSRIVIYGNNPDVDTATTPEDVWNGGGLYNFMTGATTLEVVSSNVNDSSSGTGARTISVTGLDTSYTPFTENVTLNGTTAVALANQYFRINDARILSAGSNLVNSGDITIRDSGAGTTRAILPTGYGATRQAVYTVRVGYSMYIEDILINVNKPTGTQDATVSLYTGFPAQGFYRMPIEITVSSHPHLNKTNAGLLLPEKTDFMMRCTGVGSNNTNVSAAFIGILIDKTLLV